MNACSCTVQFNDITMIMSDTSLQSSHYFAYLFQLTVLKSFSYCLVPCYHCSSECAYRTNMMKMEHKSTKFYCFACLRSRFSSSLYFKRAFIPVIISLFISISISGMLFYLFFASTCIISLSHNLSKAFQHIK